MRQTSWLEKVKIDCSESGHLEVALLKVGHVLAHTPPDPDGLWINCLAAEKLNDKDAEDMRQGFVTEVFNLREIHTWTAGKEEQEFVLVG